MNIPLSQPCFYPLWDPEDLVDAADLDRACDCPDDDEEDTEEHTEPDPPGGFDTGPGGPWYRPTWVDDDSTGKE